MLKRRTTHLMFGLFVGVCQYVGRLWKVQLVEIAPLLAVVSASHCMHVRIVGGKGLE